MTAQLLRKYDHLRGTIYDLEFSLARAGHTLREYGVDERCGIVPGDGFTEVPGGGDVHLLKSVLHTMNDDDRYASSPIARTHSSPAAGSWSWSG